MWNKGVASVWGRSGPEGSKKSRKLEAEAGREWDHCFRKELPGEIMRMFYQRRRYVGEKRKKGNKVMESFSTRQRGKLKAPEVFSGCKTNLMPPTSDVCLLGSLVFQWQLQIFRGWFVNGVFFLALGMRTVTASLNIAKSRIQKWNLE